MSGKPIVQSLEQRFSQLLEKDKLGSKFFIVAVSGGLDSMVLMNLLFKAQVRIAIAHCNFHLRDKESNDDELFVTNWARVNNVPYYIQHFDTKDILIQEGGNLQDTARALRYSWFEQLRQELSADFIATAHHANDSVETLLMNFFKGTGIRGLHGIQFRQGNIIRPLINFSRQELTDYAMEKSITWREDSSNKKDDYTRNNIRHNLIPLAEQIFPHAVDNLQNNIKRFTEVEMLYQQAIGNYRKKLLEQRKGDVYIPILKLKNVCPLNTVIYELIKSFGFLSSQVEQVIRLLDAETGKYIQSSSHRILKNRNFLVITAIKENAASIILIEEQDVRDKKQLTTYDFTINLSEQPFNGNITTVVAEQNIAFADMRHIKFPLILRRWKAGDYFYPLGMKKKKKVARFLIDQKTSMHEKEKVWVLESNKRIVWVVGQRLDDRFRITAETKTMLEMSISIL